MTDYEKWKDWLDQWDINYSERDSILYSNNKYLEIKYEYIFIYFDKDTEKFIDITN